MICVLSDRKALERDELAITTLEVGNGKFPIAREESSCCLVQSLFSA